jgi:MFS family permease
MSDLNTSPLLDSQKDPTLPASSKIFYGWWIVLASTAILFVTSGIGFYGHGVILDPLRTLHGWSKATISSAVTLFFFISGVMGLIIGRQIDRYGPKWLLIIGSVTIGTGFVLLVYIKTVWQLYAVYFIMALGFSCTSLVPINTVITNWFIRKRGFAMSLTNTGLSAGGIILVPMASYLITRWGLATALPVLGAIYGVVVIISTYFIKQRPSDVNQFPDGAPPESRASNSHASGISYASQMRVWTRTQAIRTVAFWSIVIAFFWP